MNSPESTRPCHGCPEKWNGTLDIAASGLGTECAAPPPRRTVGQTSGNMPPTPLSARARPRSGHLAECRRSVSANDDWAFGWPLSNEFCRTPLVLSTPKLARNQMFTARCVPNTYLFRTFSAQNATKLRHHRDLPGRLAGTQVRMRSAPRIHALRRWLSGGIRPPGSQRRH